MGKTRDLFKKIRDTNRTFHAKMGSTKDRNGMDLIEAEDIKKSWQEYTELYKKDLNDPDNHYGVVLHPEPDLLECEVKWALGITAVNKVSGGDEQVKGLDLVDRVPEELWTVVCNTVLEAVIKIILKEKKCKKKVVF